MVAEIEAVGTVAPANPGSGMALHPPDHRIARSEPAARPRPPEPAVREPAGNVGLVFEVNQESRELVIKIVNRETHQVIRQIPAEEVLNLARLYKGAGGVLLRAEA